MLGLMLTLNGAAWGLGSPPPPPSLNPTMGIDRFYEIDPGLFRGARPSPDQIVELKQRYALRTLLSIEDDKRAIAIEAAMAQKLGIRFVSIPLNANKNPPDDSVDRIENIMRDKSTHPLYVHCRHGRDRTGMVFGIYRVKSDHWSPAEAYDEMIRIGFRPFFVKLAEEFRERTLQDRS